MPKTVNAFGGHRIFAVVLMAFAVLAVACSSADAPERATRVPRSPVPPTSDLGATVDALVQERLSKTVAPRTPITFEPTPTAGATPTSSPESPTPVAGEDNQTATPPPTEGASTTPTPPPTSSGTPLPTPTPTIVPTPTPTFDDDHGDDRVSATIVTFEESPEIVSGEIDVLDDIDYFAISNTIPGRTWVFTQEYVPPESESGRFPTIDIDGATVTQDFFTGIITFQPGGGVIYLTVTSEQSQKLGDYRVVIDRSLN